MSNRTLRPVAMRIVRLLLVVIASVDAVAAPKRSLLHSLRNFATSAHHPRTELIREEEVSLVQYARKARFKGESVHPHAARKQAKPMQSDHRPIIYTAHRLPAAMFRD